MDLGYAAGREKAGAEKSAGRAPKSGRGGGFYVLNLVFRRRDGDANESGYIPGEKLYVALCAGGGGGGARG